MRDRRIAKSWCSLCGRRLNAIHGYDSGLQNSFPSFGSFKVLTITATTVFSTKNIGLKAFTILLQTVAFLAVATFDMFRCVIAGGAMNFDFVLKGFGIAFQCCLYCLVYHVLILGCVATTRAITVLTVLHIGKAFAIKFQTLGIFAFTFGGRTGPRRCSAALVQQRRW